MYWDGFTAMERDVRAVVGDPRWTLLPPLTRAHTLAQRALVTPDGTRWLFGAHARWYRLDRVDGRWHLSAPPLHPAIRTGARPQPPQVAIPPALVPSGPDFAYDRGSTQAFVGPDVPQEITERLRALLLAHRGLRREDFPLGDGVYRQIFAGDVASTVAAVWGTIMWCAYAPAFDGNEVMLSMFGEFLARPLPGDDWVRWLPLGSLEALVALYAERMRSGAREAGLRLAGLMTETAAVLRADPRFRPRADALIAMAEPLLTRPWLDQHAIPGGTVRQAWLTRCPPHLAPAALLEWAPGEHFRHTLYDLVEALSYTAARGMDPRTVAAALLAADVAGVCGVSEPAWAAPGSSQTARVVTALYPWMDDELRQALYLALTEPAHPLRGCWPAGGQLPPGLVPPDRETAAALLGSAYATGLAWCALTGTPAPPEGFAVCSAVAACLIHQRDDPRPPQQAPEHGRRDLDESGSWLFETSNSDISPLPPL
ncbi:hypothetical protein GCM10010116_59700 [Microbispora rosea subsp. aerata]|nr:hypothetical protein [Microbispora rosea]GGO29732.1 hypothetical protein GCM10010116_59700 [Microbispora rosea subsp. aerata]GIH58953.1 hypothetical protein Mro02_58670 [Microbispora rosea subsp. aerata]GLJ86179.1 hypothetical protein GCM10017588_49130 [Microbispora rosea subsp. aerata]